MIILRRTDARLGGRGFGPLPKSLFGAFPALVCSCSVFVAVADGRGYPSAGARQDKRVVHLKVQEVFRALVWPLPFSFLVLQRSHSWSGGKERGTDARATGVPRFTGKKFTLFSCSSSARRMPPPPRPPNPPPPPPSSPTLLSPLGPSFAVSLSCVSFPFSCTNNHHTRPTGPEGHPDRQGAHGQDDDPGERHAR